MGLVIELNGERCERCGIDILHIILKNMDKDVSIFDRAKMLTRHGSTRPFTENRMEV